MSFSAVLSYPGWFGLQSPAKVGLQASRLSDATQSDSGVFLVPAQHENLACERIDRWLLHLYLFCISLFPFGL